MLVGTSVFSSSFCSKSRTAFAAEGWDTFGGLIPCNPEGVSAKTWKCEVGGGPIAVGRLSASTLSHKSYGTWLKYVTKRMDEIQHTW